MHTELLKHISGYVQKSRGRQWKLGALNRAAVVLCLSAWEAYVESLALEVVDLMLPPAPPFNIGKA